MRMALKLITMVGEVSVMNDIPTELSVIILFNPPHSHGSIHSGGQRQ